MNILLTNFHETDGGGHTTYVLALARGLRGAGHAVHVAAPGGSRLHREARLIDGLHVVDQPFPNALARLPAILRARRQLRGYVRAHAFDIVHVNGSTDHRMALAACRGLARAPKIVLTKHNSKPARGITHRLRARRTALVIAVSEATRRVLADGPYTRCRLCTVRNGVDVDHYLPWSDHAMGAMRERWSDEGRLLLGSNAGTAAHKGWMDLVEAVALLPPAQRARVDVLLCGQPPRPDALARIDTLGLGAQVHFTGLLSDVRPVLAAIDVGFVLSYAVETISFACRETMAMGKPMLVSDYAGLPENIDHGVDGWCVPPRDVPAIAAAVAQMLDDPARLRRMGDAARLRAEREFALPAFIAATEAAYAGVLAAAPATAAPRPRRRGDNANAAT